MTICSTCKRPEPRYLTELASDSMCEKCGLPLCENCGDLDRNKNIILHKKDWCILTSSYYNKSIDRNKDKSSDSA